MRLLAILVGVFTVLLLAVHTLAFGLGCWIFNNRPASLPFDSQLWKHPTKFDTRFRMAKDLVASQSLKGKSKEEVVSLLGLPNEPGADDLLSYSTPYFPYPAGYQSIIIVMKSRSAKGVAFDMICDTGPILMVKLCPPLYPNARYDVWCNTFSMIRDLLFAPKPTDDE